MTETAPESANRRSLQGVPGEALSPDLPAQNSPAEQRRVQDRKTSLPTGASARVEDVARYFHEAQAQPRGRPREKRRQQ